MKLGGNTFSRKEISLDGEMRDGVGRGGLKLDFDTSAKRILQVDIERYQRYLDDADMSEADKADILQALWQIIISFVDLGYGVHPLQEV